MSKSVKLIIVNMLTLVRVLGIFLILFTSKLSGVQIGIIVMLIYLSDSIDGILARHWKCSTFLGAAFDGVADKLFTIVNFIILYRISHDIALIAIIVEILICVVQLIKYKLNMNIQSNLIGKIKTWILALCVVCTYFASDISSISFLSTNFIEKINSTNSNQLYLYTLGPAIICEIITLISYIVEIFFRKNLEASLNGQEKSKRIKLNSKERKNYVKDVWLNPDFYEEHKDDTNLRDLRISVKKDMATK